MHGSVCTLSYTATFPKSTRPADSIQSSQVRLLCALAHGRLAASTLASFSSINALRPLALAPDIW